MNTHNKQSQEDNCVNSNSTLSKDETMVTNKTWNIGKALTVALISARLYSLVVVEAAVEAVVAAHPHHRQQHLRLQWFRLHQRR